MARKTQKGEELGAFCAWEGDTLVLNILGTPRDKQDAIGEPEGLQLRVSVTATPVRGRATDHMVRFLAGEFGVAVEDIEVVFGRYSIHKQMRIRSPRKLPAVIGRHPGPDLDKTHEPAARISQALQSSPGSLSGSAPEPSTDP